jgi:drug/metabolite transporter (DMT)-like permease
MTPQRKDRIDLTGAFWLVMFAGLMGINQVLVKLVNDGMSPLFQAAARSYCALVVVLVFALAMRKRLSISDGTLLPGVLCGSLFAVEFMLTFVAFEYTTVARVTMLFYTMPFWLALIAHFVIPGERMTLMRFTGLMLALRASPGCCCTTTTRQPRMRYGAISCALLRPCAGPVSRLPCG